MNTGRTSNQNAMNPITSSIKRHPLIAYFLLAYALAWMLIPLMSLSLAFGFLALFGPAVSAILVTRISEGPIGLRDLWRRVLLWKVNPFSYAFAILFPPALILIEMGIAYLLGIPVTFFTNGMVGLATAILFVGEELGWRGYALPKLLAQRTPIVASLTLGVLWALWHLPNFIFPLAGVPALGPFPVVALWIIAQTFMFTWLYTNSKGSILIATLFHASINAFTLNGMESAEKWLLQTIIWTVAAVVVVFSLRAAWIQRSSTVPLVERIDG
jgi:membrane protease YdiL (CAAX protease family)